jgi:rhamnogalacturonyl hydrolase YesR
MSNRRNFLTQLSLLGGVTLLSSHTKASNLVHTSNQVNEPTLSEKVKMAMLAMQRASWEQGTAIQAAVETNDLLLLHLLVTEAILRQSSDGRTCMLGSNNNVTDPVAAGLGIVKCYELTGLQKYKDAADKLYEYCTKQAPRNSEGILYHLDNSKEIWSDSIYMLPPFLAAYKDYDECMKQIRGFRKILWYPEKKLFAHRWSDDTKRFVNAKCWGGGNGWAMASFAIIYELLPDNLSDYKNEIASYILELTEGLIAHMRTDGLFHNIVDDPNSFIETNLSQMAAFGIYKGVRLGMLDTKYRSYAEKMKTGAISKIDKFGYVQDACGSPSFSKPGTSTEAQAFFLMMEAESSKK